MRTLLAAALLSLAGCGGMPELVPSPLVAAPDDWRAVATEDDRRRIREWREAWSEALRKARAAGHGETIAAESALLDPDAALLEPMPPQGDYSCRTIKLGGQSEAMLDYVAYPRFRCRVLAGDGTTRLVKLTGSQRPIGILFDDGPRRNVFLGTLQLGDETLALQYGRDRERDMAGMVERIGERQWRLVLPYPRFESTLDVIELTPAPEEGS